MASSTIKTMTSFSGADLIVTFANKVVGELQQISWSIQREKSAVYTLGSPDPRSFSRGKRGISGSLVFAVFNNDALVEGLKDIWSDLAPKAMFTAAANSGIAANENFDEFELSKWNELSEDTFAGTDFGFSGTSAISAATAPASDSLNPASAVENVFAPAGFTTITKDNVTYVDMIPPFDITLTFANEYGQSAFKKVYDSEILAESSGASVDTIVMERQMAYIARKMSPITSGIYTREDGGNIIGVQPEDNL